MLKAVISDMIFAGNGRGVLGRTLLLPATTNIKVKSYVFTSRDNGLRTKILLIV